jgi:hypothetical protein
MTEFSQQYLRDPRYQKNLRKVVNMSPEELAVYNALTVELPFADEESRRRLQMYQLGAQKETQNRRLDMGQQRQDLARADLNLQRGRANATYDLRRQAFQDERSNDRTSNLLGMAGLGVNTMLGYGNLQAKKKLAGRYGLGAWK